MDVVSSNLNASCVWVRVILFFVISKFAAEPIEPAVNLYKLGSELIYVFFLVDVLLPIMRMCLCKVTLCVCVVCIKSICIFIGCNAKQQK